MGDSALATGRNIRWSYQFRAGQPDLLAGIGRRFGNCSSVVTVWLRRFFMPLGKYCVDGLLLEEPRLMVCSMLRNDCIINECDVIQFCIVSLRDCLLSLCTY